MGSSLLLVQPQRLMWLYTQGDPLGAISGAAILPHDPEAYLDEAFEQHPDRLCVPRQLAVLTHKSMAEVCASFDGLL